MGPISLLSKKKKKRTAVCLDEVGGVVLLCLAAP